MRSKSMDSFTKFFNETTQTDWGNDMLLSAYHECFIYDKSWSLLDGKYYSSLDTIEENMIDWIRAYIEDISYQEKEELLNESSDGGYCISHYIFEMYNEQGDIDWCDSGLQLKRASIHFALEKVLIEDCRTYWIPNLEKCLGKEFTKLQRLWRDRRDRKRKETLNKLPIHCVENLISSYL